MFNRSDTHVDSLGGVNIAGVLLTTVGLLAVVAAKHCTRTAAPAQVLVVPPKQHCFSTSTGAKVHSH